MVVLKEVNYLVLVVEVFYSLYIKNEKKKKLLNKLKNIINIPFKFSDEGCEVILNFFIQIDYET